MLEWLLEHIHIYSGMPWWGSIAATAILWRVAAFPLYLKSSDISARQTALIPITKPVTDRMTAAQRKGDREEVMLCMRQVQAIRQRAGLSYRAQFTPMILQGVIGYCGFKLLRAMSNLPVPGLQDGGFLWLMDLTSPDPWGIMPILMAGSMHAIVRMGGENGAQGADQLPKGMQPLMLYGMPGIIMLIMAWQPGALCVWFAASGALGLSQGLALKNEKVRSFFGLAPLYKPAAGEQSSPFSAMMDSLRPAESKPQSSSESFRANVDSIGGKNSAFMRPQWQAPNLNTRSNSRSSSSGSGRVIDVQPSQRNAPQPPASEKPQLGVFETAKAKWAEFTDAQKEALKQKQEKGRRDQKRKAAEEYERRATGRGR